ncbi:MAG: FG-GAP-like repeat-containing protein, partial [Candidatus Hodarchaeota archaeon]
MGCKWTWWIRRVHDHFLTLLFVILVGLIASSSATLVAEKPQKHTLVTKIPLNWNEGLGPPHAPSPPVVGDLDNDGTLEVLVSTGYQIRFFSSDGSYFGNWGGVLTYANFSTDYLLSPTILYKESHTELLLLTYDSGTKMGKIFALNATDPSQEYWNNDIEGAATMITLYYPSQGEVGRIFTSTYLSGQVYCWDFHGLPLAGWPRNFNTSLLPVILTNPQPPLEAEVIVGSPNGTLWVTELSGKTLVNWPQTVDAELIGIATSDIDGDGEYEVVASTETGWLYVFQRSGHLKPGWPQRVATGNYSSYHPLLADLDADGYQEIIIGGYGKIWVYNWQGVLKSGWPQQALYKDDQNNSLEGFLNYPIVYDLDKDGFLEILCTGATFSTGDRMIWVWTANGQPVQFDYLKHGGGPFGGLLLSDLNKDSWMEGVVFELRGPRIYVFTLETRGFRAWPQMGGNPALQSAYNDGDFDGLHFHEEYMLKTDPTNDDTDDDGLLDGEEIIQYKTDPTDDDTDNDGLLDGEEVMKYGTDPTESDTDKDELSDAEEVLIYGTDPTQSDSDDDGLLDGEEVTKYGTDPTESDTDKDELSDTEEVLTYGTNPTDPDSDNDGLLDGEEILIHKTDPTDPDTDNDGLSDGEEVKQHGTNPLKADTDGDGVPDGVEVFFSLNPLDSGDIFIIIWGIIGIVLVIIFMAGFQTLRVRRLNWLRQTWMTILQDQYIAPINISKKAAEIHLSPERGKTWLEDFLARGTPEGISGLYNPEQQIFLSFKTLQLWLETLNE